MDERLRLVVVPGSELLPRQRAQVLALCSCAFQCDYSLIYRSFQDPVHVLGCIGDAVVSQALWVTRWLRTTTSPLLRTAFVEAVATDPAHQGRGYATAVMRTLQASIRGYDLAALSTGMPGFYERLGWRLWRGPLFIRTDGDLLATPGETVMILCLPTTPPLDLNDPLSAEWREGELW